MAVLITGGGGFIGAALATRYANEGFDVLAFDQYEPSEDLRNSWPKNVKFVAGDVRDQKLIGQLMTESGDSDPVLHLAGLLTAGCDADPELAIAVNIDGTRHILEAARQNGGRRVVFASTIGVYGRNLPQPITETMPKEPDGWYGYTKIAAEEMGLLYSRRHGLDFRAARLAAVTGPFRRAKGSASMFTSMIPEKAALGEPYAVEVSEDSAYPVVYLTDSVNALHSLSMAPEAPSRIYNVGSDRVVVAELVKEVRKRIPDSKFTYEPDPEIMKVVGGYRDWHISCDLIRKELGWTPQYRVTQMVADIIGAVESRNQHKSG